MTVGLRRAGLALTLLGAMGCTEGVPLPMAEPAAEDAAVQAPARRTRDAAVATPERDATLVDAAAPADGRADTAPKPDGRRADVQAADAPRYRNCLELNDVTQRHPQVIVALDRSTSMFEKTGGAPSRMEWVRNVLRDLFRSYEDVVHFGYEEFPVSPGAPECGQTSCASTVVVTPSPAPAGAIEKRWQCATEPAWCTERSSEAPIHEALEQCKKHYDDIAVTGPRYVLLLTDSEPSCPTRDIDSCEAAKAQVQELLQRIHSVKTLVFGLGEETRKSACLSRLSAHGGVGPPHFMTVNEAELRDQLGRQMERIQKGACTFQLEARIELPHVLAVWFGGQHVPHDPLEGWYWEPGNARRFSLRGNWCTMFLSSQADDLTIQRCHLQY